MAKAEVAFPVAATGEEESPSFHETAVKAQGIEPLCLATSCGDSEGEKMGDEGLLRAGTALSLGGSTARLKCSCRALPLQGCVGFELLPSTPSFR